MTPEVIECSWLGEREMVGRGRVHVGVDFAMPQGTFVFIDGGTLGLGIVRDSVLNSTNDFQVFGETFRAAAADTTGQHLFTVDLGE